MKPNRLKRAIAIGVLGGLSMMLSACLLMPGRFVSELNVRENALFSFTYSGELVMLPLSEMANKETNAAFEPGPCTDDSGDERACTDSDIADQRAEWGNAQANRKSKQAGEAEMARAMLGGIDPSDPQAAEELAKRLRRQAGWRSVEYKGNGVYNVDFAISGRLDHDFVFPTIEGFPLGNPFVQVSLRQDGDLRIDAPGFGPAASGMPMSGMIQAAAMSDSKTKDDASMPIVDGKFTIRTDARILANNTDEGPQPAPPADHLLGWKITPRVPAAPTALLKLKR